MRDFSQPGRSAVFATNGMCATSHPLAAKVAVQILEAGGNAVDAAIAAGVLLGICEPQMTGIGGDCFVLLTPPGENRVVALNGSGRAPMGFDAEKLRDEGHTTIPTGGPQSVTMPGAVDAFCRLSKDFGRIGLAASLAPAIHYAQAGVPVAPRTAYDWNRSAQVLTGTARNHYLIDGNAPKVGQIFQAPAQAEALRQIALNGRAGFYEGAVAGDMVAALQTAGGSHTLDDFANVACDYTEPVMGSYGGLDLYEHPPNGQGATAVLLLNILKHFDFAGLDPMGAKRAHLEAEATKLAYDTRNQMIADPDHTTRLAHMLSPETAERLAGLIDPKRALPAGLPGAENVHKDTVYVTVVDKDRMCVSLIYSIYNNFGSGTASDKYGILFHNRGTGFTLELGHPNEAGPGKRPMHTIIPGLLTKDGRPYMPFGVMGGAYQATGHARFITNMRDFGMEAQAAIDAPRCFADAGKLKIESGYSDAVRQELSDLGHDIVATDGPMGGAQAIAVHDSGVLEGASDPRKDGCALGY